MTRTFVPDIPTTEMLRKLANEELERGMAQMRMEQDRLEEQAWNRSVALMEEETRLFKRNACIVVTLLAILMIGAIIYKECL